MRLLAAAYPGAFAAVSSLTAMNYHHGYSLPLQFVYPATANQLSALDCSIRHHRHILQDEVSARPALSPTMRGPSATPGAAKINAFPAVRKTLKKSPSVSDISAFSFLDSTKQEKFSEAIHSSGRWCFLNIFLSCIVLIYGQNLYRAWWVGGREQQLLTEVEFIHGFNRLAHAVPPKEVVRGAFVN